MRVPARVMIVAPKPTVAAIHVQRKARSRSTLPASPMNAAPPASSQSTRNTVSPAMRWLTSGPWIGAEPSSRIDRVADEQRHREKAEVERAEDRERVRDGGEGDEQDADDGDRERDHREQEERQRCDLAEEAEEEGAGEVGADGGGDRLEMRARADRDGERHRDENQIAGDGERERAPRRLRGRERRAGDRADTEGADRARSRHRRCRLPCAPARQRRGRLRARGRRGGSRHRCRWRRRCRRRCRGSRADRASCRRRRSHARDCVDGVRARAHGGATRSSIRSHRAGASRARRRSGSVCGRRGRTSSAHRAWFVAIAPSTSAIAMRQRAAHANGRAHGRPPHESLLQRPR